MNTGRVMAWAGTHLRPMVMLALQTMPAKTVIQLLIGYGVGLARSAGMSDDELRAALEEAIAASQIAADG